MQVNTEYFDYRLTPPADERFADRSAFAPEVLETARRVYPALLSWSKRYPVMLPAHLPSVVYGCADMCPASSDRSVELSTILCMIIFAIDDLVDGSIDSLTDAQAFAFLSRCADIASTGGDCDARDGSESSAPFPDMNEHRSWVQVFRALSEFCGAFSTSSAYRLFVFNFCGCVEGMATELRWRAAYRSTRELPTYDQYAQTGALSIGAPALWSALFCLDGLELVASAEVDPRAHEQLHLAITLAGGLCVRLMNDYRSFKRETLFEEKPNSVLILKALQNASEREAIEQVLRFNKRSYEQLLELNSKLPSRLSGWGTSVSRFVRFTADWYLSRELHHVPEDLMRFLKSGSEKPNTP